MQLGQRLMTDHYNYNEAYIDKNVGRGQSYGLKPPRLHMRTGVYDMRAMVERGLQVNHHVASHVSNKDKYIVNNVK